MHSVWPCKRRARRQSGSALILVLSLLPVLSWLSWDMLTRAAHLATGNVAYVEMSALRATAMQHIASAIKQARSGDLTPGVTRSRKGNVAITRTVERIAPPKSDPKTTALTGFVVDTSARSTDGSVTLRLSFLFRDNASPLEGVWHIAMH